MTYTLYGRDGTGSMAVEAALVELGLPFELIHVAREPDHPSARALAAVNPRGQVPALVCPDGTVVTECPAILTFLADAHPGAGLIPAAGSTARARHDRWMAFFHANLYEGLLRHFYPERYVSDPAAAPLVAQAATGYVRAQLAIFEQELGDGPFLMGERLQMFDIFAWTICGWTDPGWLRAMCPRLQRLMAAVEARPQLAALAARHG